MSELATSPFIQQFSIFILAIFVGYYVVWSVTPALHTPLMSVTNAISSVIIVGALIATGATGGSLDAVSAIMLQGADQGVVEGAAALKDSAGAADPSFSVARYLGAGAVFLASVNIFGGFAVTARMLAMYGKKKA